MIATAKEYLSNATIHGLRYLTEAGRTPVERAIWVVFLVLSWLGTALLMANSWEAFQNDAISFTVDTAYLEWDTDFPSVTFCEMDSEGARRRAAEYLTVKDHTLNKALDELAYFKSDSSFLLQKCFHQVNKTFRKDSECPFDNIREVVKLLRNNCTTTFNACYWNNEPFDCCKYFRPLQSEYGLCYSINNKQTISKKGQFVSYPMISNRTTGPGALRLEFLVQGQVFWHSHLEVPNRNMESTNEMLNLNKIRRHFTIKLALLVTVNDPALPEVSLRQRNCRFPEENYLPSFPFYSSSACVIECRKRQQMVRCNCTSHNMPPGGPYTTCNLEGLLCVSAISAELAILKSAWGGGEGIYCPCQMSCLDTEIHAALPKQKRGERGRNIVDIQLAFLPTVRYKRNVVRGVLDLVVSMGGTAGLFMGASLLSFVELLYFLLVRMYGNQLIQPAQPAQPAQPVVPVGAFVGKSLYPRMKRF